MKKKLLSMFAICLGIMAISQLGDFTPSASAAPFRRVESVDEANPMPEYPGGTEAIIKFVNENIDYPTDPGKRKEYNDVPLEIRMIVMSDGSVGPITIFQKKTGIPNFQTQKVENALRKLPEKFKPGKVNGKPVNVRIKFLMTVTPPQLEEETE